VPPPISEEQRLQDRETLLDAAEALFYERGIQAVGMDDIRSASGLSLKQIYALFATKEELVVSMLRHRDRRWRASLVGYVEQFDEPRERVLAVFDWLERFFSEPAFRGCAWINAFGELGATSPAIRDEVRAHKTAFHDLIKTWVTAAGELPPESVFLLAEGAIVTAGIMGDPRPARDARSVVEALLAAG
jgi:AcrR family transcriptional regulator